MTREELKQRLIEYFNIGADGGIIWGSQHSASGSHFVEMDNEIVDDIVEYVFGTGVHKGR